MANNSFWNELPFQSGTAPILQQCNGDFPHVFMGDGKEDFSRWCRRFEVAVEANPNYDDDSLAKLLPTRLGGAAFSYWDSLPNATKTDYNAVKDKLKVVFGQTAYLSTFQSYVNARSRLPGEALPVFAAEISRLVEEAFPTYGQNAKAGEKFRRFIAGIEPYLQLRCHEQGVNTLEAALQFAIQIENAHHASRVFSSPHTLQSFSQSPALPIVPPLTPTHLPVPTPSLSVQSVHSDELSKMQKTLENLSDRVEQLQLEVHRQRRETRHSSSDYRSHHRSPTPDRTRGRSHYPSSDGHRYRDSYYEPGQYSNRGPSHRAPRDDRDCYDRRDAYTRPGSSERHARGYSPSPRDYTQRGRSPDRRENRYYSHRSPSPGHVRFHSPARTNPNQVN